MGHTKKEVSVSRGEVIIESTFKYPIVILKPRAKLSDIGKVSRGTISDGTADFVTEEVSLTEGVELVYADNKFYINQPHRIRRMTVELLKEYRLEKYFTITKENTHERKGNV